MSKRANCRSHAEEEKKTSEKWNQLSIVQVDFFHWYPPEKLKYGKSRLGVSRMIYVSVDSPNLDFPYFNFSGGYQ